MFSRRHGHRPGRQIRSTPFENKYKQDALAMKLSDKALRLIGRSLLESIDKTTYQDATKDSRNRHRDTPPPTARTRRGLNLRRRTGKRRATVVPFRARRPDG